MQGEGIVLNLIIIRIALRTLLFFLISFYNLIFTFPTLTLIVIVLLWLITTYKLKLLGGDKYSITPLFLLLLTKAWRCVLIC